MTPDEMRDAIQGAYRRRLPAGSRYPAEVPVDVTPQAWFVAIDPTDAEHFTVEQAEELAGVLAADAPPGLSDFARLRVQDRPAAEVKTAGPAVMRRKRQFIVHALGWRVEGRAN